MRFSTILVVALTVLATACGGDDTPSTNNDAAGNNGSTANNSSSENNMSSANNSSSENNMSSTNNMACEPITSCDENQCGTIDDGCGGTVTCDTPCACEDGTAVEVTCGPCGLGRQQCSAGETGPGICILPPYSRIDSLEGQCDSLLVYMRAGANGTGTKANPIGTLEGADFETDTVVILSTSDGPLEETLVLSDAVHVIGGYDDEWVFDETERSRIRPPASTDSDIEGVRALNLTRETFLYGVDVVTPDAATAPDGNGFSNYALRGVEANGLVIANSDFSAGRGGDGVNGVDGEVGADGGNGSDGGIGRTQGGDRGPEGVNTECPTANGGEGGKGGASTQGGDIPAEDGDDSVLGAAGGNGGIKIFIVAPATLSGKPGADGTAPADGAHGDGGVSGGEIVDGFWNPTGAGVDGEAGSPGPGGGGGGGAAYGVMVDGRYVDGPGGGGGGAGGCGGEAGTAGGSGGGSFGLFLVSSSVITFDSNFAAAAGGVGGDAGGGAAGGQGGLGGAGTDEGETQFGRSNLQWSSGDGGDGAAGSRGGDGGGGAGGVSYGAYCDDTTYEPDEDSIFESATPASGGSSPTNPGAAGASANIEGC